MNNSLNKTAGLVTFVIFAVIFMSGGFLAEPVYAQPDKGDSGSRIVVANRASGTISVIDVQTDQVVATPMLPAGMNPPAPMYVNFINRQQKLYVGDRANDRIVVFDANSLAVETVIPTAAGVFHMWADNGARQLWVVTDTDLSITVIDTDSDSVITVIPIPADLAALGGFPHDVIIDPTDDAAYVAINGVMGPNDYVVKYSTKSFTETGRIPVGKDAHLSLTRRNEMLYVPNQGTNNLLVFNRRSLAPVADIMIPGTHGAGMTNSGRVFYTTNLPGGGTNGLFAVDTETNTVIGSTDTPFAVPHNIALTPNGRKLYVTHSGGMSDKVTVYTATNKNPVPVFKTDVTVGFNPFGIAYIP
jgi:YVTN family beta-propeller protein